MKQNPNSPHHVLTWNHFVLHISSKWAAHFKQRWRWMQKRLFWVFFFPAAVGPPDRLWECVLRLCSGRTQYSAQSAAVTQEIRLHCHTWLLSLLPPPQPPPLRLPLQLNIRLVSYTTGRRGGTGGWGRVGACAVPMRGHLLSEEGDDAGGKHINGKAR